MSSSPSLLMCFCDFQIGCMLFLMISWSFQLGSADFNGFQIVFDDFKSVFVDVCMRSMFSDVIDAFWCVFDFWIVF